MSTGYKHVSLDERVQIEKLCDGRCSISEIARATGRDKSTIGREIARRSWRASNTSAAYTPYRPAGLRTGARSPRQYRASRAQVHAEKAAARSHRPYRLRSDALVGWVIERLRRGWTPQEISGRLPVEFPGDRSMRVGVETLYAWIYAPGQAHRRLGEYLPRGQRRRRRRGGRRVHHERIKWRTSIHRRPPHVEDRTEFGHWEADSVLGARGTGALHTEVERASRLLAVVPIESTTAQATLTAQIGLFTAMPAHAVRSVTADNGIEFSWHYKLADTLAVPTYFADPYSAGSER